MLQQTHQSKKAYHTQLATFSKSHIQIRGRIVVAAATGESADLSPFAATPAAAQLKVVHVLFSLVA